MYSHGHQVPMPKILLISKEPCQSTPPGNTLYYSPVDRINDNCLGNFTNILATDKYAAIPCSTHIGDIPDQELL